MRERHYDPVRALESLPGDRRTFNGTPDFHFRHFTPEIHFADTNRDNFQLPRLQWHGGGVGTWHSISGRSRYRVVLMAKIYGNRWKQWKFKYFNSAHWAELKSFKTSSLRENQPQTKVQAMGIQNMR